MPPSASAFPIATLEPGTFAVAAVDGLEIFDVPGGAAFATVLPGPPLYLVDARDGWSLVQAKIDFSRHHVFGWLPATWPAPDSGEPVPALAAHRPIRCLSAQPGSLNWLGGEHPQVDLECHGDDVLTVRGYAIDSGQDGEPAPYTGTPEWLAGPTRLELSSAVGPAVTGLSVGLHLPPEFQDDLPTSIRDEHDGTLLEVTGHFDDGRSVACSLTPARDGLPSVEDRHAELMCRQRFVVDRVEVVEDGPSPLTRGDGATAADVEMIGRLLAFAEAPSATTLGGVPLSTDGVRLGLAGELRGATDPGRLADPAVWLLDAEAFRGRVGPFSALDTLARWRGHPRAVPVEQLVVTAGEHPHCASPPVPPPAEVADLRRVSVQPLDVPCPLWWTVDLYVTDRGEIAAISLDLYEP